MRILLIEDDQNTSESIQNILAAAGMICDRVELGEEGKDIGSLYHYDAAIIDLMLPDIDGYDVLRRLRAAKVKVPIMILSGLASTNHKVRGFSCGADDYMTKPFNREELVARINAIIRRSEGRSASIAKFDKMVINFDTRIVEINEKPISLTNTEYNILELLAIKKGRVLEKEFFLDNLYNNADAPNIKIIDVFICKLRKKLMKASGGDDYIKTVWGRGYMIQDTKDSYLEEVTSEFGLEENSKMRVAG